MQKSRVILPSGCCFCCRPFFVRFDAAYRAELAHFLRFARGEAENPCTVADAHQALRIAEAATLSLRERRPVMLSEIT